jgi:hypothetical protein
MTMQLYPKLADGTIDQTDVILLGHGMPHGTKQLWSKTGAGGLVALDAHHVLKAKIRFVNYWKAYKEAHTGIMMRATLADIPAQHYKGHGPIFASLWNQGQTSPIGDIDMPCALLESWGLPDVPKDFGFIREGSNSPVLRDDVDYDLMAVSTTFCGSIYQRYYIGGMNYLTSQFKPLKDTRDMEDNNWVLQRWQEAVALFDASGGPGAADPAWPNPHMRIERLSSFWLPATSVTLP